MNGSYGPRSNHPAPAQCRGRNHERTNIMTTEPLWGETSKKPRQLTHNGQRIAFTLSRAADAWVSTNAASKRRHSEYIVGAVLELAGWLGQSGDFWPALDFLVNEQGMASRAAAIEAAIWFRAGKKANAT